MMWSPGIIFGQEIQGGQLINVARTIVTAARYAGLATVDSLGYPNIRIMDTLAPTDDFIVWLGTNPSSRKVRQIKANSRVALYYSQDDKGNYVTIIGDGYIVDNPEIIANKWKSEWAEFYETQEDIVLIKVMPLQLEVVSYEHNIISTAKDWRAPTIQLKNKR